jgi:hypothetical protein
MDMKNLLHNNRITVFIVILAIGSVSGVVTAQFVIGSDGDTLKNLLGGCIYGACKDTKITGNVTDGILAGCIYGACKDTRITGENSSGGGSGGGQPTPNAAKLTVIKKVNCAIPCGQFEPKDFEIKVTKSDGSTQSFPGSATGTQVTLPPGDYTISETPPSSDVFIFGNDFSGNCHRLDATADATGSIEAGEEQECTITNTFNP